MPPRTQPKNDYPTSDGRPFDSDWHREALCELIYTLKAWYADTPNVYASGFLLLFYEKGNHRSFIAPDVFVTFGVAQYDRDNYLLWEEYPPAIVIELTSAKTRREDLHKKMRLYRDVIGVKEYIIFDPREEYLKPSLQGFRLVKGEYRPMRLRQGKLYSQQLDLYLERDEHHLRLLTPGKRLQLPIKTYRERANAAIKERDAIIKECAAIAEERAAIAKECDALEAELRAVQAELAALRQRSDKPTALPGD